MPEAAPEAPGEPPVIVVTGGARGIGACCAELFVERGAEVILVDLASSTVHETAERLGARAWTCDVSDERHVRSTVAAMVDGGLVPTGLVHCAGITQPIVGPEDLTAEDFSRVLSVDLLGTFLVNKYVGAVMVAHRKGAIVNIGSMAYQALVRLHAYGPAKAGVVALTGQLAMEWGRSGVRVNAIAPGNVLTDALQRMIDNGERDPLWRRRLTATGRMAQPREVATAAWFLLGDDASGVTGHTLHVDAGQAVSGYWALSVPETELDRQA